MLFNSLLRWLHTDRYHYKVSSTSGYHDDVIKWKHFTCYWPFVRGIHRSPVNSPHKVQWRGALMFSFICIWINGWVNNRKAGDLRRYRTHYDFTVMLLTAMQWQQQNSNQTLNSQKDIPYPALTGQQWGVCCDYFGENGLHFKTYPCTTPCEMECACQSYTQSSFQVSYTRFVFCCVLPWFGISLVFTSANAFVFHLYQWISKFNCAQQ